MEKGRVYKAAPRALLTPGETLAIGWTDGSLGLAAVDGHDRFEGVPGIYGPCVSRQPLVFSEDTVSDGADGLGCFVSPGSNKHCLAQIRAAY